MQSDQHRAEKEEEEDEGWSLEILTSSAMLTLFSSYILLPELLRERGREQKRVGEREREPRVNLDLVPKDSCALSLSYQLSFQH